MIYETTKPTDRPPTYHTSFFITFISKSINTYKESQSLKAEYYNDRWISSQKKFQTKKIFVFRHLKKI